ncbi:MAG TPA: hypothetical protein VN643_02830 [Pyrinomonadaceae bacterium]|nr:hypothetical protein [Pyrinomonadaceae bacterium]
MAGTDISNIFRAGTFYQQGEWVFGDVHNPDNTIVVELAHENYKKLIIEVADSEGEVQRLRKSISV